MTSPTVCFREEGKLEVDYKVFTHVGQKGESDTKKGIHLEEVGQGRTLFPIDNDK